MKYINGIVSISWHLSFFFFSSLGGGLLGFGLFPFYNPFLFMMGASSEVTHRPRILPCVPALN
jgi:hypothetical protein